MATLPLRSIMATRPKPLRFPSRIVGGIFVHRVGGSVTGYQDDHGLIACQPMVMMFFWSF
jgi:hypothetical protein